MSDPTRLWALAGFAAAFVLPLFSFVRHLLPRKHPYSGATAACLIAAALLCSATSTWLWLAYVEEPTLEPLNWIKLPPALIISLQIDLSAPVLVLSNCTLFISCLVHIYSITYIRSPKGRGRYFGLLGLFTSLMLGFFCSANLLVLSLFWGMLGLCSYLLIGHAYHRSANVSAAREAILFGKSADLGLLAGLATISALYSHLNIDVIYVFFSDPVKQKISLFTTGTSFCAVLFIWAAFGKSAQVPFQPWLISAMRAPTPVSAMLHSATVVAAGVFLLGRFAFLFTFWARDLLLVLGLATALFAALSACAQLRAKRLLAYSTISQLGLMMSLLALGQVQLAYVYLVVHAVAKSLLFLSVGVISRQVESLGAENDSLPQMGGHWRRMPLPYIAVLSASAVLLGLPLSAGHLAKTQFVAQLWGYGSWALPLAVLVLLATSIYIGRLLGFLFLRKTSTETRSSAPLATTQPTDSTTSRKPRLPRMDLPIPQPKRTAMDCSRYAASCL